MLIRFNYILYYNGINDLVLAVGVCTTIIAGAAASMEIDIKKIIALSTLSQLGVIFLRLGLGQTFMSFFHLVSHAYFKAIIFIAAGAIIHRVKDYQDTRKVGNGGINPVICSVYIISSVRLCGFPFISGFYSKDVILEIIIMRNYNSILVLLCLAGTILTVLYSVRVIILLFVFFSLRERYGCESDRGVSIISGILILVFPAIGGGFILLGILPFSQLAFYPF